MSAEQGTDGDRLGRHFGLTGTSTVAAWTTRGSLLLAAIRLRRDTATPGRGAAMPLPRERAFGITARLRDRPAHEPWPGVLPLHAGPYADGTIVSVVDLEREPLGRVEGPFDCLHFYVPRTALDELADDNGAERIETLSWPPATPDPVVARLGSCLVPVLDRPEQASSLFVDHVALALLAHFAQAYGGMQVAPRPVAGGLAPWQERRAKEILSARLDADVPLAEVAGACRLSPSYFARAFRQSTGQPPHRWLSERRVDRAKDMLLGSALSLAEVALACGFADQSHFTRVFTRTVGTSPGAWRRVRNNRGGRGVTLAPESVGGDGVQRAA